MRHKWREIIGKLLHPLTQRNFLAEVGPPHDFP